MNKKANSVNFVVITTASLILIGLVLITFGGKSINSYTTYDNKLCYEMNSDGSLAAINLDECCINVKKSSGCSDYESNIVNEQMFLCKGEISIIANKNMMTFCGD